MSTRAIIGIETPKGVILEGTILGAWQWNDGGNIGEILNRVFNTREKASELISQGMWSSMFTKKQKDDYEQSLCELYKGRLNQAGYRSYTKLYDVYLLRHKNHENVAPVYYSNYEEAAGQDISFIYLFDPKKNKWTKKKV